MGRQNKGKKEVNLSHVVEDNHNLTEPMEIIPANTESDLSINVVTVSKLEDYTKKILALEADNKRNLFKIASQLQIVREQELFKEGGYANVTEYGEKELNYRPSTTSALVRISQRFLDDEGNIVNDNLRDYSVYQLMELLKLNESELLQCIEDKTITPEQTTKNIRKTIKEFKGDEKKSKTTEKEELSQSDTVSDDKHSVDSTIENQGGNGDDNTGEVTPNETESSVMEDKFRADKAVIMELISNLISDFSKEQTLEAENQERYIKELWNINSMISNLNI